VGVLFGTDGVREIANGVLTPELAFRLGRAGAAMAAASTGSGGRDGRERTGVSRPLIVVGGDTRRSTGMLEAAVVAGITSAGADAIRVGVVPTPAVAYLTVAYSADAGIVISASHNPVEYNGIKFFGPDGLKLPDEVEESIEEAALAGASGEGGARIWGENDGLPRPVGHGVGTCKELADSAERYVEFAVKSVDGDLKGLHIVVDCANGASSWTTPEAFRRLGAQVTVINASPDGDNINVGCGSTHPEAVQRAVVEAGADLGLAHDGDADRLIAVDENGALVDGDQIMAICAARRLDCGRLPGPAICVTQYSNLGLHEAMAKLGVNVIVADNGDRYVLQEMLNHGLLLGGEQSGHIIMLDRTTTGDGLITAIEVASIVAGSGKRLSELVSIMRKFPQVMVNVRVANKHLYHGNAAIQDAVASAVERLGANSRLVVRPSGTEPLVRVMGEGPYEAMVRSAVTGVAEVIKRELG
jgi:phosphoglucosamine mutase